MMVANTLAIDRVEQDNAKATGRSELHAAQRRFRQDRQQGWKEFDQLFRGGIPPEPMLNGRYAGELIALEIAPGLTQFFQWLTDKWMPWLGKTFNTLQKSGDNIFRQDSYALARFFNPFYRGFVTEGKRTYRCFTFHTYLAPGMADPDRTVLKIDYDLDGNPSPTIRRILDELVQLDRDFYLGKAHVHWWWGGWQTVAYFLLYQDNNTSDLPGIGIKLQ
jgi:hypothetical protein